jgi:hypothetical protein
MWIRVQGKARGGEKAQHTRQYVSILSRHATPPWGLRRIFEMSFRLFAPGLKEVRYLLLREKFKQDFPTDPFPERSMGKPMMILLIVYSKTK